MKYNLLIDGGATSTKVYLLDANKQIIKKDIFDGVNLYTKTNQSLAELFKIYQKYKEYCLEKLYLGAPGILEFKQYKLIYNIFNNKIIKKNIYILTDIEIQELLFCEKESYLAISLGSGSVMIENVKGKKRIMSSFGPLIADEGSAYTFAKEFIKYAIIDKEREKSSSNFIKYTLEYFNFKDIEELKTLYKNWNAVKSKFLKFSVYILIKNYNALINEINCILDILARNFFEYIDLTKINKKINIVYIFGGMVKNKYYKSLLISGFNKRNYEVIIK
ncbi:hypothetical protein [Spiroplasma cantharicola]|uniref:N-acetylglucosamine kinase n=1 Tax=Spiroplasma cantharicola TaxID=362837 RepID=A0A0M5KLL0_9MOLU|nr:hypothetical protein [Spiroplasma cantharicola]ALD66526.1 hypothetical protein SCANT_v1c06200 [Spiroplasma cantharicola]